MGEILNRDGRRVRLSLTSSSPVVSQSEAAPNPSVCPSLETPGMTLPSIVEKHRLCVIIMLGYRDWKSRTTTGSE